MNVVVYLRVKFRAFGITFSTVTREWAIPLNVPNVGGLFDRELLKFDERGILLIVAIGETDKWAK